MRLFVAFELPAAARQAIAERMAVLRSALPPARWVEADSLHLTLVFLGEVDERRLDAIGALLAPHFGATPSLRLRLAEPGTFPPGRPARVAWIGVQCEGDLPDLERRTRAALEGALDRALENRPYHAHVTVARPRRPWRPAVVAAFRNALEGVTGEWTARRALLMESRLGPDPGRYLVRQEYTLAEAT